MSNCNALTQDLFQFQFDVIFKQVSPWPYTSMNVILGGP